MSHQQAIFPANLKSLKDHRIKLSLSFSHLAVVSEEPSYDEVFEEYSYVVL